MNRLPGITGTLLPSRYLADGLPQAASAWPPERLDTKRKQLGRWWQGVAAACGPATGLRALFDLVAMPLFGALGFRAHDAVFEHGQARAWLATRGGTPVGLVLLPWAERPSALWRDVTSAARDVGAAWAFLLAPPYLSLINAQGYATRRELEFTLPDVLEPVSFSRFWWLTRPDAFDVSVSRNRSAWIDGVVERAAGFQDRVREDLQDGVAAALESLSEAIAVSPRPVPAPKPGQRSPARSVSTAMSAFDEALTLVYRILFLLFAESRDLVPHHEPIYAHAYAIGPLCRNALTEGAGPGLWESLAAITRLSRVGCRTADLIVRPFNGRLFSRAAAPSLEAGRHAGRASARTTARDAAAQRALKALGSRQGPGGREEISYADLGVEQLGSVYERVLDLEPATGGETLEEGKVQRVGEPKISGSEGSRFRRLSSHPHGAHSSRRKQTGTFYTPIALADFVVRRTLAPLVSGVSADAILQLRVVDPAMGSGAFLVAACRCLAGAYERALIDEGRLAPADLDDDQRADIRRLIAERCLAGVDQNPVAVQLARLSLWLATLAHGKPLGFLDHRLRVGNSLVGASPDDLGRIAVSRRPVAGAQLPLFDCATLEFSMQQAARPLSDMVGRRDDTVADVREKEALWTRLVSDRSPLHTWRLALTLWCARWFWPASDAPPGPAELRALLDAVVRGDRTLTATQLTRRTTAASALGRQHAFFHWPLEFADVFYAADGRPKPAPGFDAVIGNPPWEMLRSESGHSDDPPSTGSDRRNLVRFVRESGLYPSCDRGHVNLYQPFLERALSLARSGGRVGLILPWGLAADDGATLLRQRLLDHSDVDTLVGLDNAAALFPIHRGLRFLVLVTSPGAPTNEIRARFGVKTAEELDALPGRVEAVAENPYPIRLTPRLIRAIGGSASRVPDVRRAGDLRLLERLTARFPALGSTTGWALRFGRELNATEDREHFGPHGLPVLEGKNLGPFRVDLGGASAHIERELALRLLPDARFDQPRLSYRDVSGVGNRLSLIAAVLPAGAVSTHTIFCLRTRLPLESSHFLCGLFNSYVLNTLVRMLMGGHLTTTLIEGLPAPAWTASVRQRHIARLAARLAARPESSRLNAALQAEVAQLYGVEAPDFRRMLEGFPLVPDVDRANAYKAFLRERNTIAADGKRSRPAPPPKHE